MGVEKGKMFFLEKHTPDTGIIFEMKKILAEEKSKYQHIRIFRNSTYGIVFTLDNMIMLTQKDEFFYHEMLVHVPLFTHPSPQHVLIIGGGDGGTSREVLKHKCVRKVDMIEIDERVIENAKKYLKFTSKKFDDKRLSIIIEDGIKYVKNTKNKYDVILIDSTDPIGPAKGLFEKEFYENCKKILKKDGLLATLSLSPFLDQKLVKYIYTNVKKVFSKTYLYWNVVPTYPGGIWSYTLGSKKYDPLKNLDIKRIKSYKINTRYYSPQIHKISFVLPPFVEELLK